MKFWALTRRVLSVQYLINEILECHWYEDDNMILYYRPRAVEQWTTYVQFLLQSRYICHLSFLSAKIFSSNLLKKCCKYFTNISSENVVARIKCATNVANFLQKLNIYKWQYSSEETHFPMIFSKLEKMSYVESKMDITSNVIDIQ